MTTAQMLREITEEEVHDFHRDGANIIKGVIADEWVELLAEGIEFANDHPDGMSAGVGMGLRIDQ
ncbi:MAG: hypothetical protein ACI9ON_002358, partial [Limisphaerales bacterium]